MAQSCGNARRAAAASEGCPAVVEAAASVAAIPVVVVRVGAVEAVLAALVVVAVETSKRRDKKRLRKEPFRCVELEVLDPAVWLPNPSLHNIHSAKFGIAHFCHHSHPQRSGRATGYLGCRGSA